MRAIGPGVWHIPGSPASWFNVYLVGDVLIDTSRRGAGPGIVKELGDRTLSLVALTHAHFDHQGSARFLCEHYRAPLACHADDRGLMERTIARGDWPRLSWIANRLFSGPPYQVTRALKEGDEVEGFRVYHTPGHTPGHVIFFRERDGIAIAGDLVNCIRLRPGLHEPPRAFTLDPAQNRRSIRKLAELDPQVICAGHGPVWLDRPRFKEFVRRLPED